MKEGDYSSQRKKDESGYEIAQKIAQESLNLMGILKDYFVRQPYRLGEAFGILGDHLPLDAKGWAFELESGLLNASLLEVLNPKWAIAFGKYTQFYFGMRSSEERGYSYKQP
jgi:hypothetical protein